MSRRTKSNLIAWAIVALVLALGPQVARAAEAPKSLLDASRGQLALGLDFVAYSRSDRNDADVDDALPVRHEFEGALRGSWNIVDELDAAAGVSLGFDSKLVAARVGLRYTLPFGAAARSRR